METNDEKIHRFRGYNRTMIAAALAKSNRRYEGIPAKLILCSIFDSLSIAAFPKEKEVGKRYRDTIAVHSGWIDHDRVSLLQLCHVLDRLGSNIPQTFSQLHNWANSEKNRRFPISHSLGSGEKFLSTDPTYQEVLNEWPHQSSGSPEKLDRRSPDQFTHRNLLWMYRNKLAHEFRTPGAGVEFSFRLEFKPYYTVQSEVDINPVVGLSFLNQQWEPIYPVGLFVELAKNSLESICNQYKKEGTSPFLSYQESSSWL